MYIVSVSEEKCIGCKQCSEICPAGLLGLKGDKAEVIGNPSECMGCESCTSVCESEAIKVQEF